MYKLLIPDFYQYVNIILLYIVTLECFIRFVPDYIRYVSDHKCDFFSRGGSVSVSTHDMDPDSALGSDVDQDLDTSHGYRHDIGSSLIQAPWNLYYYMNP